MNNHTGGRFVIWLTVSLGPAQLNLLAQVTTADDSTRIHEVHIESADVLAVDEIDGEGINRLDGNVVLSQDETTLRADRAVQYQRSDLIVFEGDVEIVDKGDTLRADRIEYRSEIKQARGRGNVVWTDGEVQLTALFGEYWVDDKTASFSEDVSMRDSVTTITSAKGLYHVEEEVAVFNDKVELIQESVVLQADSVTHERGSGLTLAAGAVRIYQNAADSADGRVVLIGGRTESGRDTGISKLWQNPVMIRIGVGESSADTLIVRADQLEVASSDTTESFRALGNVVMWRGELSGVADSLHYSDNADSGFAVIVMTGSPVLWSGDAQVTGDTIRLQLADGRPRTLTSGPNAFVAFEDTALGRIQQIRGDGLTATFSNDSLRQLVVEPQAEALYFGGEQSAERESAVQFSSSSITLHFGAGEIRRIVASNDVIGEFDKFDPDQPPVLVGFIWNVDSRPRRQTVLSGEMLDVLNRWPDEP